MRLDLVRDSTIPKSVQAKPAPSSGIGSDSENVSMIDSMCGLALNIRSEIWKKLAQMKLWIIEKRIWRWRERLKLR